MEHPGYFDRAGIYFENNISYADNAERFIFFSKCVAHLARYLPWRPDVVHVHDWQAALVPALMLHRNARRVGESAADLPDHSQSRVSGNFSAGSVCADESAGGFFHAGRRGVLRAVELPQGRNRFCRRDHDGQPALRARNHDRGIWLRPGRPVAPAATRNCSAFSTAWITTNGTRRTIRILSASLFRHAAGRQRRPTSWHCKRKSACPRTKKRAAVRHHFAARGTKRRGHPARRAGGNAERGHPVRAARQRLAGI